MLCKRKDMKKQPDFTKIFLDFFGKKPRKVQYEVRSGPCCYHDLIFLRSLIHDARFKREKIQRRGNRVLIPINRDCWELGITPGESDGEKYSELHIADAVLTISQVKNIEWSFNHNIDCSPDTELWIHAIRLESNDWRYDIESVVVDGKDWSCTLTLGEGDLQLKVKDIEIPYLYSEHYGNATE